MTKVSRMNARDFILNLSQHRATLTSIDKSGIFHADFYFLKVPPF